MTTSRTWRARLSLHRLRISLALASACPLLIIPLAGAQSRSADIGVAGADSDCLHSRISPSPGFVVSSAWDSSGNGLLMVDSVFNKIVRYDLSGRIRRGLPEFISKPLHELQPRSAAAGDSSLVVKLNGDRFVRLDEYYNPREQLDLHRQAINDDWQVTSAFQYAPANGDLITFSDIKGPGPRDWKSAFLRIPLDRPTEFQTLKEFHVDEANVRNFYKLENPYITSLGSTAYVVLMEEEVKLLRNTKGSGELEPTGIILPEQLRERPEIPYFSGAASYADTMIGVEKARMIAGLYGWSNSLYVLGREPGEEGTRWTLLQIDPEGGENAIRSTAVLPTHTNHLLAVPGPKQWAFIEKGPVESFDRQEVRSAFFVPATMIQNLRSGALCRDQ